MKISVIVPSRLAPIVAGDRGGPWFVQKAVDCVLMQSVWRQGHQLQLLIAVDAGQRALAEKRIGERAAVVESSTRSQAAALNAGIRAATGDIVAFLEDDDLWHQDYLAKALQALTQADFVSSTHLEVNTDGSVVRISDYATPSSWVMSRATLHRVGGFDETHRWHLDSEWLGRLGESALRRIHFVEATAPITQRELQESRPQLANVIEFGGPSIAFLRHDSPWPLVMRTVHPESGTAQIRDDSTKTGESRVEIERLGRRFGIVPW